MRFLELFAGAYIRTHPGSVPDHEAAPGRDPACRWGSESESGGICVLTPDGGNLHAAVVKLGEA